MNTSITGIFISIAYCSNNLELFGNIGLPSSVTDFEAEKVLQYYRFFISITYCSNDLELYRYIGLPSSVTDL